MPENQTYELTGVPILRAVENLKYVYPNGTVKTINITEKDLSEIVENTSALINSNVHSVPVKIGHNEEQPFVKDGEPSLGWMKKIYQMGDHVYADFNSIPKVLNELILNRAYRKLSAEIYDNFAMPEKGQEVGKAIRAVALLGADIPKIKGLGDILNLYAEQPFGILSFAEEELKELNQMPQPTVFKLAELETMLPFFKDVITKYFTENKKETITQEELNTIVDGKLKTPVKIAYSEDNKTKIIDAAAGALKSNPDIVFADGKGNEDALVNWVGKVGFNACVIADGIKSVTDDPEKLCGYLKNQAREKGVLAPEHMSEEDKQFAEKLLKDKIIADQQKKLKEYEIKLFNEKLDTVVKENRNIFTPAFDKYFTAFKELSQNGIIKFGEKNTEIEPKELILMFLSEFAKAEKIVLGELANSAATKAENQLSADTDKTNEKRKGINVEITRLSEEQLKVVTDNAAAKFKENQVAQIDTNLSRIELAELANKFLADKKAETYVDALVLAEKFIRDNPVTKKEDK